MLGCGIMQTKDGVVKSGGRRVLPDSYTSLSFRDSEFYYRTKRVRFIPFMFTPSIMILFVEPVACVISKDVELKVVQRGKSNKVSKNYMCMTFWEDLVNSSNKSALYVVCFIEITHSIRPLDSYNSLAVRI